MTSGFTHILRACRAEHCRAAGSDELIAYLEQRLGIRLGQTTPDGRITLSPIYCVGNCKNGPSVLIDDQCFSGIDAAIERLDLLQ